MKLLIVLTLLALMLINGCTNCKFVYEVEGVKCYRETGLGTNYLLKECEDGNQYLNPPVFKQLEVCE